MSFSNFAKVDTIYVNILLQLNLYFILNMSSIIIFSSIALLICGTGFPKVSLSAETLPIFKRCLHKFNLHNIANLTY